jgi:hypothetical protein
MRSADKPAPKPLHVPEEPRTRYGVPHIPRMPTPPKPRPPEDSPSETSPPATPKKS